VLGKKEPWSRPPAGPSPRPKRDVRPVNSSSRGGEKGKKRKNLYKKPVYEKEKNPNVVYRAEESPATIPSAKQKEKKEEK